MAERPKTLGELKQSGYRPVSVKDEMRRNLLGKLRRGEPLFPGIIGYDDTVIPEIQNAILSRHDILLLGLRGQAKTRMLRMLVSLLDDAIPIVAGSEINDDPLAPISRYARERVAEQGDACPIEWIGRDRRYHEKLATPDVTIADLIGEVDLIKHAEGRHLSSEDVMHFGLIPRTNRGIFCINELPDLSPKIQVGLFNVLEERDVQIRGFTVRLPLDVCMVFSANPEDYTNRGRIVTPLKDRIGSVIRTHYPRTRWLGVRITQENAWAQRDGDVQVRVPAFMADIIEEISRLARCSPHVNQASGVSVRMSIANYENVISNVERRSLLQRQGYGIPRISDLTAVLAGSRGKIELSMADEPGEEDRLLGRIVEEAVKVVFDEHFSPKQFRSVLDYFDQGRTIVTGDALTSEQIVQKMRPLGDLLPRLRTIAAEWEPELMVPPWEPHLLASLAEFVLEGLYCHNRLNKKATAEGFDYGR
ncbi:MAG: magnesium chelatase [Planctomycetota bacterium]|nr:MAG: magnesium chelatase [Planctomycetota bacterium]